MADPYIDPFETKIYGKFAREQMAAVLMGKVAALDGMVEFAMGKQLLADQAMSDVLDRQPKPAPELDTAEVLDEARDVIVRFASYLDSLKGRPVDTRLFFRGEAPSVLARRRLTKLTAAVGHIADEPRETARQGPRRGHVAGRAPGGAREARDHRAAAARHARRAARARPRGVDRARGLAGCLQREQEPRARAARPPRQARAPAAHLRRPGRDPPRVRRQRRGPAGPAGRADGAGRRPRRGPRRRREPIGPLQRSMRSVAAGDSVAELALSRLETADSAAQRVVSTP